VAIGTAATWLTGYRDVMPKKGQRAANQKGERAADSLAPQYPIESVDNALKLLLLLGQQPQIRLSEATRYLGVASSTAHRLLAMLAYRGFVRQDQVSKAYLPGPSLTGVAFAIFSRIDIQRSAMPIMRSLSEQLRETIHVGMLDGASVRFVAAVEGPAAVRVASRFGRTMPAHCTSTGKAMLAQLAQAELRQLLPDEQLQRITSHSIGSRTELEAELSRIRERGYAVNREESEEGVASVAVVIPTRAPGLRIALNAAAPQNRLDAAQYSSVAAALIKAAKEIGDQLG
jgi:DNA-binding IclR family transcriptional regulator